MIGWPTFSPCFSTSTVKFGDLNVPNCLVKMLAQELPHDGVAADAEPAVSAPTTPTPPTKVSVAAAASTLLLKDMNDSSLGTLTAVPCARLYGAGQDRNGWPDRSCGGEGKDPRAL